MSLIGVFQQEILMDLDLQTSARTDVPAVHAASDIMQTIWISPLHTENLYHLLHAVFVFLVHPLQLPCFGISCTRQYSVNVVMKLVQFSHILRFVTFDKILRSKTIYFSIYKHTDMSFRLNASAVDIPLNGLKTPHIVETR